MIIYRLGSSKYAREISGEGAKINGGRWNHIGTPCVYAAESRALAILEYSVNNEIYKIPRALSIASINTGKVSILELTESDLPGNWKNYPAPTSTKDFGTKWLRDSQKAILKLPSTIIADEYIFVLNPNHPDFKKIKIVALDDFVYDMRIKAK